MQDIDRYTGRTQGTITQRDNLRQFVEKYFVYWKWIVLSALLGVAVAHIALRYSARMYRASAKVMVLDKENHTLELTAFGTIPTIDPVTALDDQIQIIRSTKLMEQVVRKNMFYVSYRGVGRFIDSDLMADELPFTLTILNKPEEQKEQMDMRFIIRIDQRGMPTVTYGNQTSAIQWSTSFKLAGEEFVVKKKIDKKILTRDFEITIQPLETVAETFLRSFEVEPAERSNSILLLSYIDRSKRKAEIILGDLIQVYDTDLGKDKSKVTEASTSFVNERLSLITADLQLVDKRVEDFKTSNRIVDIETKAILTQDELTTYEKQLFELRFQQQLINRIQSEVERKSMNFLPENLGIQSPVVATAISGLNTLLLEREDLLRQATPENPVVITLTHRINRAYDNLGELVFNADEVNRLELANIETKLQGLHRDLSNVPRNENDFKSLARQQQIIEAMYLFLLQKREEMEISASATPENIKMIEQAKGRGPISPVAKDYYLVGFALGIAFPMGILFFKFMLDNKVGSRRDVEERFSAPIVGEIPSAQITTIHENDRSPLAEAFRILRTNMAFMLGGKQDAATLFVTSTTWGEGKTFVATNLARILSLSAKRVLLVGADIRSPKVLDYLDLSHLETSHTGITEYLINQEMDVEQIVIKKPEHYEFDVIPVGYIAPNPAEILMNGRFKNIIAYGRMHYDYVIVDTAPVSLVTDTLLIADDADITLFVVRAHFLDKRLLSIPAELYEQNKLKNMAVIVNDLELDLGYGYGYGYRSNTSGSWRERAKEKLKKLFKR